MITKDDVIHSAKKLQHQENLVQSMGIMNTPTDIEKSIDSAARYRVEIDILYKMRSEHMKLFDKWCVEGMHD